mmetsp:Transcript_28720/g.73038  ORF Transcript_28720/g.73038 Transcript_28720/m.73038 type:complete len:232 (+) Transcript_28720:421-1116(+)
MCSQGGVQSSTSPPCHAPPRSRPRAWSRPQPRSQPGRVTAGRHSRRLARPCQPFPAAAEGHQGGRGDLGGQGGGCGAAVRGGCGGHAAARAGQADGVAPLVDGLPQRVLGRHLPVRGPDAPHPPLRGGAGGGQPGRAAPARRVPAVPAAGGVWLPARVLCGARGVRGPRAPRAQPRPRLRAARPLAVRGALPDRQGAQRAADGAPQPPAQWRGAGRCRCCAGWRPPRQLLP